ncbi:uncharacterized protein Z518_05523 [Rhinocladiella mackenziei CBS 650.93]|uniref:Rhinocladiella mackenziei CBS 650.93 unplaced genomic scaffold supercont1.4, whole genome shotgun sequence n=1 Tax=Rhinocladiella mackenziei CBS 650.93 TaxID=1442369 RepID=A0A0D2H2J3_9EURO|nr:uncharacterized protein Z518_05523 [Rhinocladiella mackenziei CBS 650.93]KIX04653.1 hypothetical protein Z518_05523 [Rhinocladiella mackenziei CBS 650.93]
MPRKRTHDEMDAQEPEEKKSEPSLLHRIRNMWEFASVMQYIFLFGKAVKIDEDFDIEDFENECLKPGYSEKLEEIGLTLLKWISSHRGLNYDIWDEYTRRQYLAKAPHLNPYGDDEEPKRFRDFDIFTKIRILHQLTVWTFWNPDRMREKMTEHQREVDQQEWRIEEFGYDREDRQYYLLDDNRFYRRTEPPLPSAPKAKPKANSKKAIAARRRENKRRKLESETPGVKAEDQENVEENGIVEEKKLESWEIDTLGGFKWECLAITLSDYQDLCESFRKSKDPNEKALRERLITEVIPIIEAAEEKQRRKMERRERELLMMERMVGAKRSSRLADKQERERRDAEQAEVERKRQADLVAARKEQERQEKIEQERQYRLMTREQRIKDREYKRLLKEEELARDALEQQKIEEGQLRGSGRHLKERIERNKKELEDLNADEEWTFDCSGCGMHGKNLDDGSHSVACERCNVWQHSKCLGISKSAAENDDFHFVCKDCKRREEDAKKPKISLKFKVGTSSSPAPPSPAPKPSSPRKSKYAGVEIPKSNTVRPPSPGSMANGHQFQQSSPSSQSGSSPYRPPHGFMQYPHSSPQHAYLGPQPRPSSSSPPQPYSSAPGFNSRPPSSGCGYPVQPAQPRNSHQGPASSPPPQMVGYHQPYHNGIQYQYQNYPGQRPLAAAQNTPRQPPQASANTNGQPMTNTGRLPSPVLHPPTISPTQGNMDVGPVAGIPQNSPSLTQSTINGSVGSVNGYVQRTANGISPQPQATPGPPIQSRSAQSPTTASQALSGLSPKKQQSPVPSSSPAPIPSHESSSMSPSSPTASRQVQSVGAGPRERRSVSGTPVLPPVENLRPSPEQLRNMSSTEPVPTPRKQLQPGAQPGMETENGIKPGDDAAANPAGTAAGQDPGIQSQSQSHLQRDAFLAVPRGRLTN